MAGPRPQRLRTGITPLLLLLAAAAAAAAPPPPTTAPAQTIPPATAALFDRWVATERDRGRGSAYDRARGAELDHLAAAPDADLCLLKFVDERAYKHDQWWIAACARLQKLNTRRSYDALTALLHHPDPWRRINAIDVLTGFDRPGVDSLLIAILERDPSPTVQGIAARALGRRGKAAAEEPLLRAAWNPDQWLAVAAADALGTMDSTAGLAPALYLVRSTTGDLHRAALGALATYPRPAAVDALVAEFEQLAPRSDDDSKATREAIHLALQRYATDIALLPGPTDEDDADSWDWQNWWARTRPQLTDHLKPLQAPKAPTAP